MHTPVSKHGRVNTIRSPIVRRYADFGEGFASLIHQVTTSRKKIGLGIIVDPLDKVLHTVINRKGAIAERKVVEAVARNASCDPRIIVRGHWVRGNDNTCREDEEHCGCVNRSSQNLELCFLF